MSGRKQMFRTQAANAKVWLMGPDQSWRMILKCIGADANQEVH